VAKPECWSVLRVALQTAITVGEYRATTLRAEAGVQMDAGAFARFLSGEHQTLRQTSSAILLWDWCRRQGRAGRTYLEMALTQSRIEGEPGLADALEVFYGTQEGGIQELRDRGLEGFYYGYKRSFRNQHYMLRSLWHLSGQAANHLLVKEWQLSSGRYEPLGKPLEERSRGVAVAKSDNLWLMLRIEATREPRVICLNDIRPALANRVAGQGIDALAGHVFEFDHSIRITRGLHNSAVLLLRADNQRASEEEYRAELDMLPSANWRAAARRFQIPRSQYERILRFIFEGVPFFEPGD
jgi:hypothetical protein